MTLRVGVKSLFYAAWLSVSLSVGLVEARPVFSSEESLGTAVLKGEVGTEPVEGDWIPWPLDFENWSAEHLRYLKRTYDVDLLYFEPSMIVMHYTVTPNAVSTYNILQRRHVTVHFLIDRNGEVYLLTPVNRRCNGAYGVDHLAISIEMVAVDERDLLRNEQQIQSSFRLVDFLSRTYNIPYNKIVGHHEVAKGVSVVPEYLDLHDKRYPYFYPPHEMRYDPGDRYMGRLRSFLRLGD